MWKHVETLGVSFGCHLDRPVPLVRPTGDERPVQGEVAWFHEESTLSTLSTLSTMCYPVQRH